MAFGFWRLFFGVRFLKGIFVAVAIAAFWSGAYWAGLRATARGPERRTLRLPSPPAAVPSDALGTFLPRALVERAPRDPVRLSLPAPLAPRPRLAGPAEDPQAAWRVANAYFQRRLAAPEEPAR